MAVGAASAAERRRVVVQGIVQGVGFRPFVYATALRLGLAGFVRNDSAGVTVEVEGPAAALDAFERAMRDDAPPLARVDRVAAEPLPATGERGFAIAHSQAGAARRTLISPDTATCADCLRELLDPADRRYRYPFINCTNCGPRYTIVLDVPYDRPLTTMREFPLCPACRAEYDDPLDRRFHAQPNACPVCGPQLEFSAPGAGTNALRLDGDAALRATIEALRDGQLVAIKGLGGYHLVCDAANEPAVARLRARKRREAKPFALMVPDLETAARLCRVGPDEAALLQGRQRPIVLLERRPDAAVAAAVAPGFPTLGLMLPYTPLHHLLLRDWAATQSADQPAVLVMTSGNLSDEPIAYRDADARERLGQVADVMLRHDRPINIRCDDSVTRVVAGGTQFLRRSRGYAPEPITLPWSCPVPILAVGGHLKNTLTLGSGTQAIVSHHIGDLENLETLRSFREAAAYLGRLFDVTPEAVAYDLHPEYLATKEALKLPVAARLGVQHHHAHIASVIAEHGLTGPVIGVAADGTGYGLDGAIWGCEIMVADLQDFTRLAHLRYVPLPGGDQAVRQPWRVAAAYLEQTYGAAAVELPIPFARAVDQGRWRMVRQMLARDLNCPRTSSLGRLFDAVAALIGLRHAVLYEGQAAIELEALAVPVERGYPFDLQGGAPTLIDPRPLIQAVVADIAAGVAAPVIAGRFHRAVADVLAHLCDLARRESGIRQVALSGGVFQNRLLLEQLTARLGALGLQVYLNRRVPPNDGGLSFGQLAVAAARLRQARVKSTEDLCV